VCSSDLKDVNINSFSIDLEIKKVDLFVSGASKIVLTRKSGKGNLSALKFVFVDEAGLSHTETLDKDLPRELETKDYYFSPSGNIGKIKSVSLYPVVGNKIGKEIKYDITKVAELPKGLVSWWKLKGDLKDYSGKNDGKIIGEVNFIDYNTEKIVSFNNGYINFGNSSQLNIYDNFAISFWIKTNFKQGIVIKKENNYEVLLNSDGSLNFSYSRGVSLETKKTIFNNFGDNNWHHVLITNLMIYVDGNPDNSLEIDYSIYPNDNQVLVGNGFNGYIRDIMIFNKSLDFNQAKSIFESQI
jgi:hypothetical protein